MNVVYKIKATTRNHKTLCLSKEKQNISTYTAEGDTLQSQFSESRLFEFPFRQSRCVVVKAKP